MKVEEKLKVILTILFIILICLASFGGILVTKGKFVEDIIPEYKLGMDLKGSRLVEIKVDDSVNTVIYDKDGKVVTEEGKDTTKKEEPVNSKEVLTQENYKKVKQIIEKRFKALKLSDYTIRLDEKTGKIIAQLPEDSNTDVMIQYMLEKADLTIENDAGDVLLDNSHVKKAQVRYEQTKSGGVVVYLDVKLDEEGKNIFKDITNKYIETTDDEGNKTGKKVTAKIGGTSFEIKYDGEITNGIAVLEIGEESTNDSTVQSNLNIASNVALFINNGNMPITYTLLQNRYIMSDITKEMFYIPLAVIGAIILIAIIFLAIRYKKNGIFASVSLVGYIATLLLILRYANVVLTMEGMIGIIVCIVLDYIFTVYLLSLVKQSQVKTKSDASSAFKGALIKTLFIFIPVTITAVILCFASWLPIYSFGMVAFWGLLLIVLYNLIITRTLIVNNQE